MGRFETPIAFRQAAGAVLDDGVPAMTSLQPGQAVSCPVGDEALKAIAVVSVGAG
jgi:hypothetical protein